MLREEGHIVWRLPERYHSIAPSGVGEVLQLTDAGKRAWCSHTGGGGGGGGGGDTSSAIAPLRMRRRRSDIAVRKLDVDGSTHSVCAVDDVWLRSYYGMDPIRNGHREGWCGGGGPSAKGVTIRRGAATRPFSLIDTKTPKVKWAARAALCVDTSAPNHAAPIDA